MPISMNQNKTESDLNKPLWEPKLTNTQMQQFKRLISEKYRINIASYEDLYQWSVKNINLFWQEVLKFTEIIHLGKWSRAIDESVPMKDLPEWFKGATLSYAENLIHWNDNHPAIITYGRETKLSYSELYVEGVLERFSQVQPKLLISANAVAYNDKIHDHLEKLRAAVKELPTLLKVVVVNWIPTHSFEFVDIENALPFNQPLFILYSSGTTGKPKCLGTLIQHKKEHMLHGNLTRADVVFQYTTTGWMMWNWLISVLSVGATIVLYDGSPFKPHQMQMFKMIQAFKITAFGTSAKFLQTLEENKKEISKEFSLDSLRYIYSTGSPLPASTFEYVYQNIKADVLLGSITGGTDIISLFAGHNVDLPVYKGEIQCRCLGMAIEAWNTEGMKKRLSQKGKPVYGESGDLVCIKSFPSMPIFFWDDMGNEKYRKAYFDNSYGVWMHGDFIYINPDTKGLIMLGRRYLLVFRLLHLVVGQKRPQDTDERVVLFLKMTQGCQLDERLINEIKLMIRNQLSPRHYTTNGKKVEVAVKRIISGQKVVPSGSLANPNCLKLYKVSHPEQYPDAKKMVAYAEFRCGYDKDVQDQRIIFYGLRFIIENYVNKKWTIDDIERASAFFKTHNANYTSFPFPEDLFLKFIKEKDGYFPVKIEALPEGTVVYPHVPVFVITAEKEYSRLVTYLETILTMVWYPSTVATLSRRMKDLIEESFEKSVDEEFYCMIESRLHDFGFRGCTSVEQSIYGGCAHLLNFTGSDTMSAAYYAQFYLNYGKPVATSIPATEHSDAIINMIEKFGSGIYSIVMDSYDYANALNNILPVVASKKLEKGGILVLRPDSGNPSEVVLMALRAAEKVFGASINKKGYKGDGVTFEQTKEILKSILDAGFSSMNLALGMGGGLLQTPVTGSGKMSLPGEMGLPTVYPKKSSPNILNALKTVYDQGPMENTFKESFDSIKGRISKIWPRNPKKHNAISADLQKKINDAIRIH
ncbi:AMP-binding domain-containing protein [Rozella allomycis CSF55]|uniref:AMP-binding domain-containing protein n=1 Tax=Rozella allomycis (strain CSF55) TaxID=988480 RepID=A0A075AZH4_ROZAC|nr:AMP-binding domain-containing protein [Rozella allomycis CSF55]|eukprot:EPZ35642.1 AMP-binding domain-containing protein [Rozella allomycis CSF55]